ncbi:MAG: aminoglycoside phosphotransferase family protein [Tissierellia bacterium]|nr:aminoglycoside phosphotransferase family protein [Tissierellia bacterium]
MEKTRGLKKFVKSPSYRKALNLPNGQVESYELLGQGEYNRNYLFTHPYTREKLVLRLNFGSQMHLENQIKYEFETLKLLETSGRTPIAIYVDDSKKEIDFGVLVMEFLEGNHLDYKKEVFSAAECLADIHSLKLPDSQHLIEPKNSLRAILDECEDMFKVFWDSNIADPGKKIEIRELLDIGQKRFTSIKDSEFKCIVNTELNSTNFLVKEGRASLVDWEKPIYGDPAQDLGHFLAPTTTFWKTDVILTLEEMNNFIDYYIEMVGNRFPSKGLKERVMNFIPANCLRGITWSAMAWVEYRQPDKEVFNESTFNKLDAYLSDDFLESIREIIK